MTPELIDLQSSHATQLSKDGNKGEWKIKKNITGEVLRSFPSYITDDVMFSILDFSKEYELKAFNAGIKFQKGKENIVLLEQIKELKKINKTLFEENKRLASILDNLYQEV